MATTLFVDLPHEPIGKSRPARLRAAAVYLHVQQLIPEDRAAQTLADLFGADRLCPASVMDWVKRLAPVADRIGALVAAARVRCLDETGFRIAGKTQWLHTAATESDVPKTLSAGWSSTTASNPMAGLQEPTMRSATPITYANSRR